MNRKANKGYNLSALSVSSASKKWKEGILPWCLAQFMVLESVLTLHYDSQQYVSKSRIITAITNDNTFPKALFPWGAGLSFFSLIFPITNQFCCIFTKWIYNLSLDTNHVLFILLQVGDSDHSSGTPILCCNSYYRNPDNMRFAYVSHEVSNPNKVQTFQCYNIMLPHGSPQRARKCCCH